MIRRKRSGREKAAGVPSGKMGLWGRWWKLAADSGKHPEHSGKHRERSGCFPEGSGSDPERFGRHRSVLKAIQSAPGGIGSVLEGIQNPLEALGSVLEGNPEGFGGAGSVLEAIQNALDPIQNGRGAPE